VDSYGGWNKFKELVHQNSLGPLDLGATKEERAAAEKAFLDYVKRGRAQKELLYWIYTFILTASSFIFISIA
jgi:hypothetical protein